MPPRMEFFKGASNFSMGNVEFNTVQGDYHDYSVRNVRNTYGNKNRYYTNNSNSFNDHSTNYAGDHHEPASHYHGPVNNIGHVQNANFGENYGTINQGTTTQTGGGGSPPRPAAPGGPGFAQGPPPPGPRPGPGPVPNNQGFTASSTAIPQHEGFPQQRGPPPPEPLNRPPSGPPMPEGHQAWQQQQRPPPPAFPPQGPQGYPQHPPQNPNFRPTVSSFPPPQHQQQPPQQQQQRQGSEQWPGQHAYKQGMAHLKQSSPSTWEMNSSGSSDTSDEDGSETEGDTRRRKAQSQNQKGKRMEDPNRTDYAGMMGGGSGALGAGISLGGRSVSATAAGGARVDVNFGAVQGAVPVPPQGMVFNQPQRAPSPAAPSSRGQTPQPHQYPPTARRDPSPMSQRRPSPQPVPQQQQQQQQQQPPRAPSPAVHPVAATDDLLTVPPRGGIPNMAAQILASGDPRRRSTDFSEEEEEAGSSNGSPESSPQDKKKKKKHRNPFSFLSSKKK